MEAIAIVAVLAFIMASIVLKLGSRNVDQTQSAINMSVVAALALIVIVAVALAF